MAVNLSDLGGNLLQWLSLMEEQMDTSKLQEKVRATCCGESLESSTTAMNALVDLTDFLRQNGFSDDVDTSSELQILIAKKIDELTKSPLASAPKARTSGPIVAAPDALEVPQDKPAGVSTESVRRKIVWINLEKQEIADTLKDAEETGDEIDDEQIRKSIRDIRRKHFTACIAELDELLENVRASGSNELPKADIVASASAPAEEPKIPNSPAKEEAREAVAQRLDPELLAQKSQKEKEIASLHTQLLALESDKNHGDQAEAILSLGERLSRTVGELEQIMDALS